LGFQAEKLTVADINDDDACESIAGEDRMPLLRVSIAGSEASIEMGEGRAQAGFQRIFATKIDEPTSSLSFFQGFLYIFTRE